MNMLHVQKTERTKLRRLPFLPRIGVTVDVAGRQITFKYAPILETMLNVRERGFSLANFAKVAREEMDEIRFPVIARGLAAVKDLHAKASEKGKVVKKAAAAKAAAKKKAPVTEEPKAE